MKEKRIVMAHRQCGQAAIRIILFVILIAVGLLAYFLFFSPIKPVENSQPGASSVETVLGKFRQTDQAKEPQQAGTEARLIQSITLKPDHPTGQDTLTVHVVPVETRKDLSSFEYAWKINAKPPAEAQGGSLSPKFFKKGDRVCVIVIPIVDGEKGFPSERACAVILGAVPLLELKALTRDAGGGAQLQLVGVDPDGGALFYELEPPVPEGLSIDKKTGMLRWSPAKKEKSIVQFKASATTADRVKTTKTFEFTVDVK